MLNKTHLAAALALGAAVWLIAGCRPAAPGNAGAPPAAPRPVSGAPNPGPAAPVETSVDVAQVRTAIAAAIKQHPRAFPRGVAVTGLVVQGGVADVDFNKQFNGLTSMGDSTEAAAQKHLRAALAAFPAIEKMRVTVQGKPFDSQMTDWTTPFPVRESAEEKAVGSDAASEASAAGGGR
jgi:hypothetical protein